MTPDTRSDAETLLAGILNFKFLVLLNFWNIILGKIDRVQKRLQNPTVNFKEAASDLESLEQEIVNIRDNLSQVAVDNGKEDAQLGESRLTEGLDDIGGCLEN